MMRKLTIAIPTYNRDIRVIGPTLETLVTQDPDARILVVDQTPQNTLKEVIKARFPKVDYIFHEPPGLPGARNRALAECTTEIILFCDDDVRAAPDWTKHHLAMYKDADVGAVVGRVIDPQDTSKAPLGEDVVGRFYHWGTRLHGNFHATCEAEVDSLFGCNMSFRTEALKKIGGFNVQFAGTSHLEETDVSLTLKEAGWRLMFTPKAELTHLREPSGGCRPSEPFEWIYWYAHNFALLHRRHFSRRSFPFFFAEKTFWLLAQAVKSRSLRPMIVGAKGLCKGITTPIRVN